jgi:hypothetical protein
LEDAPCAKSRPTPHNALHVHTPTSEAAGTQRSPVVNAGTPATPEPDHGADLDPPPYDMPPPVEAAGTPNHHPPEQIRGLTNEGEPLESLQGEQTRRATGQMGLTLAHAPEGKTPIGEAHGRPPDLPDPLTQGSTVWEPESDHPKARVHVHQARRPVLDEGAHTRPDPWPSPSVVNIDPDTCIRSASQLEGEQNFHKPCVGSELHAAPSTPQLSQHFSFSPLPLVPQSPDTLARENSSCGEGVATERRVTEDRRPEPWKPPDAQAEDLQEAGGVPSVPGNSPAFSGDVDSHPLGLVGLAEDAEARKVEPSRVDVHERGGVLPVVGAAPALAESTAGVEPAGEAERAAAARPEALASRTQGDAGREAEPPPREGEQELESPPHKGRRKPEALPPECKYERAQTGAKRKPEALPPEGKRELDVMPQGNPNEGEREVERPSRECTREHPKALPPERERGCEPSWLPREPSKRPVETMDTAPGIDPHNKTSQRDRRPQNKTGQENPGCAKSVRQHHHEGSTTHLGTYTRRPILTPKIQPVFRFEAHREGATSSLRMQSRESQRGRLLVVTPASHAVTRTPRRTHTHWPSRATQRAAAAAEHNPCAPPFLWRSISLQYADRLRNEGECRK